MTSTLNSSALWGLLLSVALYASWIRFKSYIEEKYCAVGDVNQVGWPGKRREGTCIIVGASISGILAARVCSTHFEKVILLDAENVSTDPTVKRTRVKQHAQLHLLLGLLLPALRQLFPTFEREVTASKGATAFVPPHPVSYRGQGFLRLPRASDGWNVRQIYLSRELFEATLRKLLLAGCGNVRAMVGSAQGIVVSEDRKLVVGAKVRLSDLSEVVEPCVALVDASGTTNGSIGWLRKASYPAPKKIIYDPAIVYSCFTFRLPPATIKKYDALNTPYKWDETGHIGACFSASQHSVFMRIEDNRVRTMYQTFADGLGGEPTNPSELELATAKSPYLPWQQRAISLLCRSEEDDGAEPPTISKVTVGVCYRVEYTPLSVPSNLIPLGDTLLRVNPIFGQGCTKSMVDVLTLDNALRRFQNSQLTTHFLSYYLGLQRDRTMSFWNLTRWNDYAYEITKPIEGETHQTGAWWRSFNRWVMSAACKDQDVGRIVTEIAAQLRPATNYYYPAFLLRCAWANCWGEESDVQNQLSSCGDTLRI